ncbi:2OG-Fe(II) oxygenase [Xylophilus rhododendri]|uniref:2OG-Fe(II) oxygenase n=1 Tax=Xylophilus rhododendri TaxID=2697032 RepID=A0A857J4D3_9BURK|nr:2OG-Fe(II) oxygenase [Xylophilus rhododendri]QHI97728.1 2OG-Fe(II) oxygenase [Xylophilus rhododendri]
MPARRPSSELQDPRQSGLFSFAQAPPVLPPGMVYQPDFLTPAEERHWLAVLGTLPLVEVQHRSAGAGRRVIRYGGSTENDDNRQPSAGPLPEVLEPLRHRAAGWLRIGPDRLVETVVAEYRPGMPSDRHGDEPDGELGAQVSLGAPAMLQLRPSSMGGSAGKPGRRASLHLEVAPRSVYRISGEAGMDWQLSVSAPLVPRWSVTFRTADQRLRVRRPLIEG